MREKEKGDWKNLTVDEKKQLYRASFRLTFAEINAPSGRYKSYFGWAMLWQALALWLFMAFYYASKSLVNVCFHWPFVVTASNLYSHLL